MRVSPLLTVVLLIASCAPADPPTDDDCRVPSPAAVDGATLLGALERALVDCPEVRVQAEISAEGAATASFSGTLELSGSAEAALEFEGVFMGTPVALELTSDGERMRGGNGSAMIDEELPTELRRALAIGLTRMGALHNLARLTQAVPPDRAAGGVAEWVRVEALELGADSEIDGREAVPLSFDIVVADQPAGEAVLWLDRESGLPLLRKQTVRFPQGEMRVTERYVAFELR